MEQTKTQSLFATLQLFHLKPLSLFWSISGEPPKTDFNLQLAAIAAYENLKVTKENPSRSRYFFFMSHLSGLCFPV
jgi:hypothetical protein